MKTMKNSRRVIAGFMAAVLVFSIVAVTQMSMLASGGPNFFIAVDAANSDLSPGGTLVFTTNVEGNDPAVGINTVTYRVTLGNNWVISRANGVFPAGDITAGMVEGTTDFSVMVVSTNPHIQNGVVSTYSVAIPENVAVDSTFDIEFEITEFFDGNWGDAFTTSVYGLTGTIVEAVRPAPNAVLVEFANTPIFGDRNNVRLRITNQQADTTLPATAVVTVATSNTGPDQPAITMPIEIGQAVAGGQSAYVYVGLVVDNAQLDAYVWSQAWPTDAELVSDAFRLGAVTGGVRVLGTANQPLN